MVLILICYVSNIHFSQDRALLGFHNMVQFSRHPLPLSAWAGRDGVFATIYSLKDSEDYS